jgi:hypothetical protein
LAWTVLRTDPSGTAHTTSPRRRRHSSLHSEHVTTRRTHAQFLQDDHRDTEEVHVPDIGHMLGMLNGSPEHDRPGDQSVDDERLTSTARLFHQQVVPARRPSRYRGGARPGHWAHVGDRRYRGGPLCDRSGDAIKMEEEVIPVDGRAEQWT